MALDPKFVGFVMNLCTGSLLDETQAQQLAAVLESREELLAYVLTRTEFLAQHPDVRQEVARLAEENGYAAQTVRTVSGLPAVANTLVHDLGSELAKILVVEAERTGPGSPVDGLRHRLTQLGDPTGSATFAPERWIEP
jgi:hypothetical protein